MVSFELSSPAFMDGTAIPAFYTSCDGSDRSPPLEWTGVLSGTKSLALIMDDPDAPDPEEHNMTWVHWVLYNIPPDVSSLPEGVSMLPDGTLQALNDWKQLGYGGPSPPIGTHRYFFKLYALDETLPDLGSQANKASVESAMAGHILGQTQIIGLYKRGGLPTTTPREITSRPISSHLSFQDHDAWPLLPVVGAFLIFAWLGRRGVLSMIVGGGRTHKE